MTAEIETVGPPPNGNHGFHGFGEFPFCAECRDEKAQAAADADTENAAEIDRMTIEFAAKARDALTAAYQAQGALGILTGALYDIELAEGSDGGDALAELETAQRALRNVARIAERRRSLMLSDPRLEG